jgi:catechol 2,3-dioxygenase
MSDLPQMKLGHVGLFVEDLPKMRAFYKDVLGFLVTDEGEGRHAAMVFMSRNPEEHHQMVLATGRPPSTFSVVNQISFRVESLKDLRAMHDRIEAAGCNQVRPTDHGNSWSVYFLDPEGNRLEVYMATPWYITQPYAVPLDMSKSDDQLYADCEATAKADPGYMAAEDWREKTFGAV